MFSTLKCLSVEATSVSIAPEIVSVNTYLNKFFIFFAQLMQFIALHALLAPPAR